MRLCYVTCVVLLACGGDDPKKPVVPTWDVGLPATAALPKLEGRHDVRGIVHLHSPFSHDACDGDGYVDGVFDEDCLADLKRGLCITRQDFAYVTDHPAFMAEQTFDALYLLRGNDEPVYDNTGVLIGARVDCGDGFRPLLMVGFEDELMPVAMHQHTEGDAAARELFYNGYDAATANGLREVGATVMMAHTEQRPIETLLDIAPDGVEIYNLHANLDPNIRANYLGLPGFDAVVQLIGYILHPEDAPIPDLTALVFLELSRVSVKRWEGLTLVRPTAFSAGTDAHQNVSSDLLSDGERLDSYRRMMRWFSNHLYVDELTPAAIQSALATGRGYVAWEVLGTPTGFAFTAQNDDAKVSLGEEISSTDTRLHVSVPTILQGAKLRASEAVVHAYLYRVTGTPDDPQEEIVGEGSSDFSVDAPGPGVYHVEVTVVPMHLEQWLGPDFDPEQFLRPFPWLFSGAIYLRP